MRPTKLTSSIARILCEARRKGASVHDAAAVAGIPREYISRWIRRAKISHSVLHVEFARMWREAEEYADQATLDSMRIPAA